jgi:heme-degrading monooxygenase HmoA
MCDAAETHMFFSVVEWNSEKSEWNWIDSDDWTITKSGEENVACIYLFQSINVFEFISR